MDTRFLPALLVLTSCTVAQPSSLEVMVAHCPQPVFFATTNPPDETDLQHAAWALAGCKRRGHECLIRLTKVAERNYQAWCGGKR